MKSGNELPATPLPQQKKSHDDLKNMDRLVSDQVYFVPIRFGIIHDPMNESVDDEQNHEWNVYLEPVNHSDRKHHHECPAIAMDGQGGQIVILVQRIWSHFLPPLLLLPFCQPRSLETKIVNDMEEKHGKENENIHHKAPRIKQQTATCCAKLNTKL